MRGRAGNVDKMERERIRERREGVLDCGGEETRDVTPSLRSQIQETTEMGSKHDNSKGMDEDD